MNHRFEDQLRDLWSTTPESGAARDSALRAFRRETGGSRRRRRVLGATAVLVVGAVGAGSATAAAARGALPGDATYGVKLALEKAEVALAPGDAAEADAWLSVAETRVEEAVRAGAEGRYDALPEIVAGYRSAVGRAQTELSELPSDAPVRASADRELRTHERVLTALAEVVPAPAREALRRALQSASKGDRPDRVPPVPGPPLPAPPDPSAGHGPPERMAVAGRSDRASDRPPESRHRPSSRSSDSTDGPPAGRAAPGDRSSGAPVARPQPDPPEEAQPVAPRMPDGSPAENRADPYR